MATVTITTTAPQDARLGPAFGDLLHLGQNATTAQVKQWLIDQLTNAVIQYEQQQAIKAIAAPGVFTPT
jgi:hypothetical protein